MLHTYTDMNTSTNSKKRNQSPKISTQSNGKDDRVDLRKRRKALRKAHSRSKDFEREELTHKLRAALSETLIYELIDRWNAAHESLMEADQAVEEAYSLVKQRLGDLYPDPSDDVNYFMAWYAFAIDSDILKPPRLYRQFDPNEKKEILKQRSEIVRLENRTYEASLLLSVLLELLLTNGFRFENVSFAESTSVWSSDV